MGEAKRNSSNFDLTSRDNARYGKDRENEAREPASAQLRETDCWLRGVQEPREVDRGGLQANGTWGKGREGGGGGASIGVGVRSVGGRVSSTRPTLREGKPTASSARLGQSGVEGGSTIGRKQPVYTRFSNKKSVHHAQERHGGRRLCNQEMRRRSV